MAKISNHKSDLFQQQAIDSTARGIRIVAPAGSGKSETLARRVAKRIDKDGIDPRRILVLTFDNAAKKSLTTFFSGLLTDRQMPQIRTFNSHGRSILRKYFSNDLQNLAQYPLPPEVREIQRKADARSHEFPVLTWDGVARKLTEVFVALKEQGFSPTDEGNRDKATNWLREEYLRVPREGESASIDDYWSMPSASAEDETYAGQIREILSAFTQYDVDIRATGYMEYIDQKSRAVQCLRRSTGICKQLQSEFDEIVVDECQDISRLDAMLVYYTAGPETLVVLAGDDDQTLYEWRNAHSLYLRHPDIVFKHIEFETIHLNLNYRSPESILQPAVKLISHNAERIEKSPTSGVHHQGALILQVATSSHDQYQQLGELIREELQNGRPPADIGVLLHNPQDERTLATVLRGFQIPLHVPDRGRTPGKPGVELVSFLKAKGRQWPLVVIPNVIDRDVPDADSVRKGEVEAVRRRFYVAMTRASEKLVLSYVRGGDADHIYYTSEGDVIGTNGASRFLFEAGVVSPAAPSVPDEAPVQKPAPVPVAEAVPEVPAEEPSIPEPAPKPEPVAPEPAPITMPAPKKGRLKAWDPRAEETRQMVKARSEWESGDYDTAIFNAWKPIEGVLNRMVKYPPGTRRPKILEVIDEAVVQRLIDMEWQGRLHLWRQVRNQASHTNDDPKKFSPERFRDIGFQMVDGVSEFFIYLAERNAPVQLGLETQDDFLRRLTNLVTQIQQDKPSPVTGKPLRALRFHPDQRQFDVLAMQLLMVLRDVRFYVPEAYRWSTSPLISKFAVDSIGHVPNGFRTSAGNRLRLEPGEQLKQLMERFHRMVEQECGDQDPAVFLREHIEDALALENGNFHSGLKLNPRGPV